MHDEQMAEEKRKLIRLLLSHMNCRFYPLACRSFTMPAVPIDRAVTAMLRDRAFLPPPTGRQGTVSSGSTSISGWSWPPLW